MKGVRHEISPNSRKPRLPPLSQAFTILPSLKHFIGCHKKKNNKVEDHAELQATYHTFLWRITVPCLGEHSEITAIAILDSGSTELLVVIQWTCAVHIDHASLYLVMSV